MSNVRLTTIEKGEGVEKTRILLEGNFKYINLIHRFLNLFEEKEMLLIESISLPTNVNSSNASIMLTLRTNNFQEVITYISEKIPIETA